ncbi:unnamed protein product [Rotaria sp. Silwood1]|nr:unnamed protein product [Rotaria sp. Silwood1]CAF4972770.1 unnamed protein product [Rotaria sp. Silwood1]
MGEPYLLTFRNSVQLSICYIERSPSFFLAIWVHIIEECHTAGLSLLVFRVLSSIDNVTGLFIFNSVCIIPAILNLLSSHRGLNRTMKILTFLMDIASVFMQLCLPLALFLISLGYWETFAQTRILKQKFFEWFQQGIRLA